MQLVCPHCMARNRIPYERLSDGPLCGKCREQLLPAVPLALGGDAFDRFTSGTALPVLVDFWAEWCGPCQMMAPEFAAAARQRADVHFVKVDTENNGALAGRFGIRSIPTLLLMVHGREVARTSGAMSASQLLGWVDSALSKVTS